MTFLHMARDALTALGPLFEQRCASCGKPVPTLGTPRPALCPTCTDALMRRAAGFCSRCGNLMERPEAVPAPCGACLAAARPWNAFYFHGAYKGLLRDLLLRLKNGHELPLAHLLGMMLSAHPELSASYDAIVPLPLHPKRLRLRGFNQSLEIARPLARRTGAAIVPDMLTRTTNTRTQTGLTRMERNANVRGIFSVNGEISGMRLLLVDDIATTCASVESAVRALLQAGAQSVDVAVVARTPEHTPPGDA